MLSQSYFSVATPILGPLLDEGPSSTGFSINSHTPSLGSFSSGAGEPPLWQQILTGLGGLNSLLDSYIFTEQERAWMETRKVLAEAEKAKAEAEKARYQAQMAAKERARPDWLLVAGAVVVGGIVVYLLLNK